MEVLQINKKKIENEEAFIKEIPMSQKVIGRYSASLVKEIKTYCTKMNSKWKRT